MLPPACSDDGTAAESGTATAGTTSVGTTGPTSDTASTGDPSSTDPSDTMDPTAETSPTTDPTDPTSDAGTDSGGSDLASCQTQCGSDSDCLVGGEDYGYACRGGTCLIPCDDDDTCIAYFSLWLIEPCMQSSDCDLGTCIAFGDGQGGCAFTPDLGSCLDLDLVEVQRMTTEGATVTVCAEPNAVCLDVGPESQCVLPCSDFVDCYGRQTGDTCTSQGQCVYSCTDAADCPATSSHDNVTWACG